MNQELILRGAGKSDAAALLAFFKQVGSESSYLTLDEAGVQLKEEQLAVYLEETEEKSNNAYFLAFVEGKLVGVLSVTADYHERVRHIGEVFVAVLSDYQGLGIASFLFEGMLEWVLEVGVIHRLELICQARNQPAVALYEKQGFTCEAKLKWGARDENGQLIDTLLFSKLIS